MNVKIKISCLYKLNTAMKSFDPTHVVSILDPDTPTSIIPAFNHTSYIQKMFYDSDNLSSSVRRDLEDIYIFIKHAFSQNETRLLVHCHLGISRSTAIAYLALLLKQTRTLSAYNAFEELLSITNKPWPNLGIIKFYDNFLSLNSTFVHELIKYRKRNPLRIIHYRKLNNIRGVGTSKFKALPNGI